MMGFDFESPNPEGTCRVQGCNETVCPGGLYVCIQHLGPEAVERAAGFLASTQERKGRPAVGLGSRREPDWLDPCGAEVSVS